jgi:hypothetical protein
MRKLLLIVIPLLILFAGYRVWDASVPKVLASHSGIGGPVTDYSGEQVRGIGGFTASRGYTRKWFKDSPFIYLAGMVFEGVEGKTTSIGGFRAGKSVGISSIDWIATIQSPVHPSEPLNPDLKITLRFDLQSRTVTLTNTGEELAYTPGKVFTVYVDKDLKITRFDFLDPDDPPTGLEEALVEDFTTVMSRRHELAEQGGAQNP